MISRRLVSLSTSATTRSTVDQRRELFRERKGNLASVLLPSLFGRPRVAPSLPKATRAKVKTHFVRSFSLSLSLFLWFSDRIQEVQIIYWCETSPISTCILDCNRLGTTKDLFLYDKLGMGTSATQVQKTRKQYQTSSSHTALVLPLLLSLALLCKNNTKVYYHNWHDNWLRMLVFTTSWKIYNWFTKNGFKLIS